MKMLLKLVKNIFVSLVSKYPQYHKDEADIVINYTNYVNPEV